jgi:hypothetical protein
MHILLVNTNPVVSRLIALKTRDNADISVEEIDGSAAIPREAYDLLFVDEQCCGEKEMRKFLRKVHAGKKVLFSVSGESGESEADSVILKPFLPSDITAILQPLIESGKSIREEEKGEEPEPSESEEALEVSGTEIVEESLILDGDEIEKIKQILIDEELDGTAGRKQAEEPEAVTAEEKKKPKKKKKKKSSAKTKEKKKGFEENLLAALVEMKPKKIRKLLKGAEVNIAIRFPEEG